MRVISRGSIGSHLVNLAEVTESSRSTVGTEGDFCALTAENEMRDCAGFNPMFRNRASGRGSRFPDVHHSIHLVLHTISEQLDDIASLQQWYVQDPFH